MVERTVTETHFVCVFFLCFFSFLLYGKDFFLVFWRHSVDLRQVSCPLLFSLVNWSELLAPYAIACNVIALFIGKKTFSKQGSRK
jgi:hypothetical protein